MKKGFNRYENGEEESPSQSPSLPPQPTFPALNFGLASQFAAFSGGNGYSEGMVMTLFQIVEQQSRALQALMGKVESITQRTLELTDKIRDLRKIKREERETDHDEARRECGKGETVKGGGDILEASALIRILFGPDKRYQYRLQLAQKLELPLYRQRNFFLQIELRDLNGQLVKNCNKIPLSLALYSSQNPPKFIEKNTAGQKILKGYVQQSLHQGSCRFQKIQIKQVTSHFRNGWVFIVIIPSMTPLGSATPSSANFVDYTQVQPLVLERVVVKAKKLKEPRRGEEAQVEAEVEEEQRVEEPIYSEEK